MDPVAFLDVADQFQASHSEAERRTSIGRSYYALYQVLFGAFSSQGILFSKGSDDHGRLVYYLFKCGDKRAYKIGADLRDLRVVRNDADHHMNMTINISESQLAYAKAKKAVVLFKGLTPTDFLAIVQHIKAPPRFQPRRHP